MEVTKSSMMDFDELLQRHIGVFGRSQKLFFVLLAMESFFSCFQSMSSNFMAGEHNHWCDTPVTKFKNCTFAEQMHFAIPREKENMNNFHKCYMHKHNYSTVTIEDVCPTNRNVSVTNVTTDECNNGWLYDREQFSETLTSEFDLVCDDEGLRANVAGAFMFGRLVGSFLAGQPADMWGRRKMILICGFLNVIMGAASAFAPNYTTFIILRFFMSIFIMGKAIVCYCMVMELIGVSRRVAAGCLYMIFWAFGYMFLSLIAYFIRQWRLFQLVISLPEMLIYIIMFICLPESPRWLLVKGRHEEAYKVLHKLAKFNKVDLPKDLEVTVKAEKSNATFIDLFRTGAVRLLTFNLFFNWFANSFVYYGLSLNTGNLGGDPYINNCISGAVEIPAYLVIIWFFSSFGRIWPYGLSMVAGSVALLCTIPVPEGLQWLSTTLSMIGKFFISSSFVMAWVYTSEVYPTSIRAMAISIVNLGARVSSILASYVFLLASVNKFLPIIIFGVVALSSGILVFVMPETKGIPMLQTVTEGEKFIRENSCAICKRKSRRKGTGETRYIDPYQNKNQADCITYM